MTIGEKMRGFSNNLQEGAKVTSVSFLNLSLRLISGAFLGFTLALIGQELTEYGSFSLILCTVVVTGIFMRLSRGWNIPRILVFDLICVLVAQLLRMYILLAP